MYPLWAMSTGRVEIEGPNGGLRTLRTRCDLSLCALSVCLITYLSPALPPEPNSAPYGLRRGLCVFDLYCLNCDDLSLSWDSYFTVGALPLPLGRRPRRRRFGARTPKYTAYLHEPL